ncbi:MAG TPA: TIM barrel protein [Candidatus Hydrogenedentes bacterium]|nr:TIM barrel protein [Candidatus Hydrogenedentota bacterium]HPU98836.1 TIM barrel protein [Candidatus Hydrogenedentota bacterium]
MTNPKIRCTRRQAMGLMTAAAAAPLAASLSNSATAQDAPPRKGLFKQSASRWCYDKIPLDEFCLQAKAIGLKGIDLLSEPDWKTVIDHGLEVSMANGPGGIPDGWNEPKNHENLIRASEELIPKIAAMGIRNMIVFSGNRRGMDDRKGMKNCAEGLKQILPLAEKHNITIIMELLNSKRNHKDYMCDRTAWGVGLCDMVGSDRLKLLYDIYHMQIMEGDIIDTIREFHPYIGHYHTGGVPGRNDIDETQELNYRRIMEAIAETGYTGFVAHEFVPALPNPLDSLRRAFEICNV